MITFKNGHPDEKTDIPDGSYMTIKEFAEEMDVSEGLVRMWIMRGNITAIDYYGRKLIPNGTIVRFSNKKSCYAAQRE